MTSTERRLSAVCGHLLATKPAAGVVNWLRGVVVGGGGEAEKHDEHASTLAELGLDPQRMQSAWDYMDELVAAGKIPGGCVAVGRGGARLPIHVVGHSGPVRPAPARPPAVCVCLTQG